MSSASSSAHHKTLFFLASSVEITIGLRMVFFFASLSTSQEYATDSVDVITLLVESWCSTRCVKGFSAGLCLRKLGTAASSLGGLSAAFHSLNGINSPWQRLPPLFVRFFVLWLLHSSCLILESRSRSFGAGSELRYGLGDNGVCNGL